MPGLMADPEDFDKLFNSIVDRLEGELDVNPEGLSSVTVHSLTDLELAKKFNSIKQELLDRGELLNPTTDVGKDLHAEYHGCLLEMKKRKLM